MAANRSFPLAVEGSFVGGIGAPQPITPGVRLEQVTLRGTDGERQCPCLVTSLAGPDSVPADAYRVIRTAIEAMPVAPTDVVIHGADVRLPADWSWT